MIENRVSLTCVVLLICCPLFSQKLELTETIETKSSQFEYTTDLSKYVPYVSEGRSLVSLNATGKMVLHQEDRYIWSMDYNRENKKIVYTFGSADAANMAIFDIARKERILLGTEIFNRTKDFRIVSFGDAHWIDSDSIVFVTVATDFQKRLTKYSLRDRSLVSLAQAKEIDKVSVNKTFGILVYVSIAGNTQDNHFLNLSTRKDIVFSHRKYSSILPLSDRNFLAKTYESTIVSAEFANSPDSEVTESKDEINAIMDYNEETHRLIALTNRSSGTVQYSVYVVDFPGKPGE